MPRPASPLVLAATASLAFAAAAGTIGAICSAPPAAADTTLPPAADVGKAAWFRCDADLVTDGHAVGCFERMPARR